MVSELLTHSHVIFLSLALGYPAAILFPEVVYVGSSLPHSFRVVLCFMYSRVLLCRGVAIPLWVPPHPDCF